MVNVNRLKFDWKQTSNCLVNVRYYYVGALFGFLVACYVPAGGICHAIPHVQGNAVTKRGMTFCFGLREGMKHSSSCNADVVEFIICMWHIV